MVDEEEHARNVQELPSCISGELGCVAYRIRGEMKRCLVPLTAEEQRDLKSLGRKVEREWFANRGVPDCRELSILLWNARRHPARMRRLIYRTRSSSSQPSLRTPSSLHM